MNKELKVGNVYKCIDSRGNFITNSMIQITRIEDQSVYYMYVGDVNKQLHTSKDIKFFTETYLKYVPYYHTPLHKAINSEP